MAPANCSHCGRSTSVPTWQSLNTALDPDLKTRVKDGSLFVWECPYCGQRNLIQFPLLYHDPEAKLMVWLLPGEESLPPQASQLVQQLEGYTLRRVREAGALIEKVNLQDAGLEDTVMEMCKWVTRRELAAKNPEALQARLRFLRLDGADHNLVLAFSLDGQMQVVNVGFNVYEDARGILLRNPSVAPPEGFSEVDEGWIEQYFR